MSTTLNEGNTTRLQSMPIKELFQKFLLSVRDPTGGYKYREMLDRMGYLSQRSIVVDYEDLSKYARPLTVLVVDNPDKCLQSFNAATRAQLLIEDPEYAAVCESVTVRMRGLPRITPFRRVGEENVGTLVCVEGAVTTLADIRPLIVTAAFRCGKCNEVTLVPQKAEKMTSLRSCECHSKQIVLVEEQSKFVDSQMLGLRELPEDRLPSRGSISLDVRLTEDMVDAVEPGARVSITGTVRRKQEMTRSGIGLRTFSHFMDANFVKKLGK